MVDYISDYRIDWIAPEERKRLGFSIRPEQAYRVQYEYRQAGQFHHDLIGYFETKAKAAAWVRRAIARADRRALKRIQRYREMDEFEQSLEQD